MSKRTQRTPPPLFMVMQSAHALNSHFFPPQRTYRGRHKNGERSVQRELRTLPVELRPQPLPSHLGMEGRQRGARQTQCDENTIRQNERTGNFAKGKFQLFCTLPFSPLFLFCKHAKDQKRASEKENLITQLRFIRSGRPEALPQDNKGTYP